MNLSKKITTINKILTDYKAVNITAIKSKNIEYEISAMVIASARSSVHAKSLANYIKINAKQHNLSYLATEGDGVGEWILVDLDDIIVHIMLDSVRSFYQLESLWD